MTQISIEGVREAYASFGETFPARTERRKQFDKWFASERGIQPGDWVERIGHDLDPREVIAVGLDWLALDFGEDYAKDAHTRHLPKDNYRVTMTRAEAAERMQG